MKQTGPLLDRIDIHIEVTPIPFEKWSDESKSESNDVIRERITKARKLQSERFLQFESIHYNAQIGVKQVRILQD